ESARTVHRMHAGDPELRELGERLAHGRVHLGVVGGRQHAGNQLHRGFAEDPRRFAPAIAIDPTPRRVLGCAVDARDPERLSRYPGRMAVFALEVGWPAADGGVELLPGRKRRIGPLVVVPTR